jgi:hypothetical protein
VRSFGTAAQFVLAIGVIHHEFALAAADGSSDRALAPGCAEDCGETFSNAQGMRHVLIVNRWAVC